MINYNKDKIVELCRNLPVKQLWLFGSVLTEEFSGSSDIDVLVTMDDEESIDRFDLYFHLKEKLEDIFNRTIDLVINKKFNNTIFQASLDLTKKIVYERQNQKVLT